MGGSMLKPLLVAEGKTSRSLTKFGNLDGVIGKFTNKGWVTEECIVSVLEQISKKTNGNRSLLILDNHPSHKTKNVAKYAKKHNIILLYTPKGFTYKYQPLDVGVNGIIKMKAMKMYSKFMAEHPDDKYTHQQCLEDLLANIKEISRGTITGSFSSLKSN